MNTSVAWINDYIEPAASAEEQAEALTRAGFPMEHSQSVELPDGERDVRQDIELTSNRGDCLCHIGLAREIAAISGRSLRIPNPAPKSAGRRAAELVGVVNRELQLCPYYSARVILGVKLGPSPKWLSNRLLARGDIPRNNIVDASNFVLFEFGQPTHVFDLKKLSGPPHQIIIRKAKPGEPFLPIGEGAPEIRLAEQDLVIADADRAVALAGVKGGAKTAVSNATTDILIEAATFAPATVRATSRRLGIASDSSFRFERGVHPGQVNLAADRLAELILDLCGGTLCEGAVADGAAIPPQRQVTMRCDRCRKILGMNVQKEQMMNALERLGFQPRMKGDVIQSTVPHPRLDVQAEIDLIEEVGRMVGLDAAPIADTIQVRVAPPQPSELARRAVNDALSGMGYVETVTHSLVSEPAAEAFLPPGMELLRAADERAQTAPALRPSILPSLLEVFARNADHGVKDAKLFETAAIFAAQNGKHVERTNLAFLHPAESDERGIRQARGVIDRLVEIVMGPGVCIDVESTTYLPWFSAGAVVRVHGEVLGVFGRLAPEVCAKFGIADVMYAAELGLPAFYDRFPPETEAHLLPSFPSIERDVSAIVDDHLPWIEVKSAIDSLRMQHLEAVDFVTTFRGKQVGGGKKSLTLRARFRAADRTLTHDEVSGQMEALMAALQTKFGAEIRQ